MPKLKSVENKIERVENVKVHFKQNGKNLRGDKDIPKQYEAMRMLKNSASVSDLKAKLAKQFPGFDFDVLKASGTKASGQTKLSTVRDTYLSDDGD